MQRHSDPYFHYHSIQNIQDYLANQACQVGTVSNNQIPTVSAGEDKAIPKGTFYYLTATANDPDGDALTYCWEQLDSGRLGFRFWTQSTEWEYEPFTFTGWFKQEEYSKFNLGLGQSTH